MSVRRRRARKAKQRSGEQRVATTAGARLLARLERVRRRFPEAFEVFEPEPIRIQPEEPFAV